MSTADFSRKVFNAAIELAAAWRDARPDHGERKRLIEAVEDLLPPLADPIIVEQGRDGREGGNYLKPAIAVRMIDLLKLGLSHRQIRREIGVSKGTVSRYERMHGPFQCPCGRERLHRGWCRERLKRSPARIAFLATWTGGRQRPSRRPNLLVEGPVVLSNWPYLRGKTGDGQALVNAVNEIVPRTFPDHIRSDICQELLLIILEGEATIDDLRTGKAEAIKRYWKMHPGKFGPISLDAPLPGTDGLTLMDTIAAEIVAE